MSEEEVVETPEEVVEPEPVAADWDSIKSQWAGEDEGKLKNISRYNSVNAALDAMVSAQSKISSGDYKSTEPFPDQGSPEDQASWRANNNIPQDAKSYGMTREIEEENQAAIDKYLNYAFEKNIPQDQVTNTIDWFYEQQGADAQALNDFDGELKQKAEDELRVEWGNEYRPNINRIENFLDTAPEGVKDSIWNARTAEGALLRDNPDLMRFFVDTATTLNPASTLVPGKGDNIMGAIGDELKTLEGLMANKTSEYWKGAKAEGHQQRYRELIAAQEQMKR